jgi:hypothetical protein
VFTPDTIVLAPLVIRQVSLTILLSLCYLSSGTLNLEIIFCGQGVLEDSNSVDKWPSTIVSVIRQSVFAMKLDSKKDISIL